MKKYLLILFSIMTYSCSSQELSGKISKDTIPDFWNQRHYERVGGYNNKVVKNGESILYTKITFPNSESTNFEYFRINDSVYKFIEYYEYDSAYYDKEIIKSTGSYLVTNQIIKNDTCFVVNPADGTIETVVTYYKKVVKIDGWNEIEGRIELAKKWTGNYKIGKRTNIWKQYINGIGTEAEIQQINYDIDTIKPIYIFNKAYNKSPKEIEKLLLGNWTSDDVCNFTKARRLVFFRCSQCDLNGYYSEDYINLSKDFNLLVNYDNCDSNNKLPNCKWKVESENKQPFIILISSELNKNSRYKIFYIDNKKLIIERE